jgi:asparagine synthase (glutamine-hydrolysing)
MSERPIGCLLSGGLDSSLVASVAASLLKEQGRTLRTFSIGMKEGTDIVYAR